MRHGTAPADIRIVDIVPRAPPTLSALPPPLVIRCALSDRQLSRMKPLPPGQLAARLGLRLPFAPDQVPSSLAYLQTPGARQVVQTATSFGERWGRSTGESLIAHKARHCVQARTLSSHKSFIAALESTASAALERPTRLRQKHAGTRPDRSGAALRFTPAEEITPHLDILRRWLQANTHAPATIRAAVSCQFLLCCHPFPDGNGRTARLVANAALSTAGMSAGCYLPLQELFLLSLGGMEVRSRRVELTGDWSIWIAWFADLVTLGVRVSSGTTPGKPSGVSFPGR